MIGAGYYYCSTCLAERFFYGALEKEKDYYLGLIRHALQHALFKPVCEECGSRVNWNAGTFLSRGQREKSEAIEKTCAIGDIAVTLAETRQVASNSNRGIAAQGVELGSDRIPDSKAQPFELEWDESGLWPIGNIKNSSGALVGRLKSNLNPRASVTFMNDGEVILALRSARAVSDLFWAELYIETGSCFYPKGLPKWTCVASLPVRHKGLFVSKHVFNNRNAALYVYGDTVAFVDIDCPTNSNVWSRSNIFGFCKPGREIIAGHICEDERHLLLQHSEYQPEGHRVYGLLAIDLDGDSKPVELEQAGSKIAVNDRNGPTLIRSDEKISIYPTGRWDQRTHIQCNGGVVEARLSRDAMKVIAEIANHDTVAGNPTGTTFEIWHLNYKGADG